MAGEVQLNDVAEIIMGQSPPGSTYNESGVGLPFFQGVRDFNYRHPSIRVFCSEPTRIARPGDILFSVRAPIGRVNIADVECSIGRGLSIIRAKSHADRQFIEFVLRSMEQQWQVIEGGGSVFGNATRRDLATLSLPWPGNPREREAVGCLLGALDDKIELNRRMNRTLEDMARALFKSWFVDFLPVRAKMAARTQTGDPVRLPAEASACLPNRQAQAGAKAAGQQPPLSAVPGTAQAGDLKPEIAALFPYSLEDSELGEIPKGWRVQTFTENIDVIGGGTPKTSNPSYWGGDIPWFSVVDTPAPGEMFVISTEKTITQEGVNNSWLMTDLCEE
jgi:type I restriction enzyme S subunit